MILTTFDNQIGYIHTPKTGSRTMFGLFALAKNPKLFEQHPEYFIPRDKDPRYSKLRQEAVDAHGDIGRMGWNAEQWQDKGLPAVDYRICIVRDPVRRFVSGYTNRVLFHEQTRTKPSFGEFVSKFEYYYEKEPDIRLHFAPQHHFIGKDPAFFTHVFNTENFEDVFKLFEEVYGREFPRFRLQQGGNDMIDIEVTPLQAETIRQFYKEDCEIWNL